MLIGGAAFSLLAAFTGFWDWFKSTEQGTQARRTANAHAVTMLTVTALIAAGIAVRALAYWDQASTPVPALILSIVAAALTVVGGTLGGTLAFDYGFNVETAGDHPVWHRSETDVFPGDEHSASTGQPSSTVNSDADEGRQRSTQIGTIRPGT